MNAWEVRYTSPGSQLQRERERNKGPNLLIVPGKQFCEHGGHYVPRVSYVTKKGWMRDECWKALKDAA